MANCTKIKINKSYVVGTTQVEITITNEATNTYIHITAWNYETRNSWGHKASLYGHLGDTELENETKAVYYNRTCESYRFQSVIHSVVRGCKAYKKNSKLLDNLLERVDTKARKMYI